MINISTLFDPRYVFLIYIPILFAINKQVGHRMMIALTLAEWMNQILKWLLAGERPYWYVHERAQELAVARNLSLSSSSSSFDGNLPFGDELNEEPGARLVELKQFPVTCELGAGSPSGHSMVTATVWYILIDALFKGELRLFAAAATKSGQGNEWLNRLATLSWTVYGLMLVSVGLSRVYLACHFPHQCLCGALLGAIIARTVIEHLPMERLNKSHFCLGTLAMFSSALGTYALLRSLGMDPLWSVHKAMRWCAKKEYIHLDTTPFFSMMRYLGVCLGAGLAYDGSKIIAASGSNEKKTQEIGDRYATKLNEQQTLVVLVRRALAALLAIGFGQFLLALPVPKSNLNVFYAISLVIYTAFAFVSAKTAPALAKRLMPTTTTANNIQRLKSQ